MSRDADDGHEDASNAGVRVVIDCARLGVAFARNQCGPCVKDDDEARTWTVEWGNVRAPTVLGFANVNNKPASAASGQKFPFLVMKRP